MLHPARFSIMAILEASTLAAYVPASAMLEEDSLLFPMPLTLFTLLLSNHLHLLSNQILARLLLSPRLIITQLSSLPKVLTLIPIQPCLPLLPLKLIHFCWPLLLLTSIHNCHPLIPLTSIQSCHPLHSPNLSLVYHPLPLFKALLHCRPTPLLTSLHHIVFQLLV